MSDQPELDLRKELVRIDRDRAETQKLLAEAQKFKRERWIVPFSVIGAVLAAIVARLPELLKAFGVP